MEGGVFKFFFFLDEVINKYFCFSILIRNIWYRRGEKVVINVLIFKDKNILFLFIEIFFEDDEVLRVFKLDYIYMDVMGFGMGNCCF